MTRKYSITVPDLIGRVIDAMSELRGEKPTSTASYLLTKHVDEGLQSGLYKDEDHDEQPGPANIASILKKLAAGTITDGDLLVLADAVGLSPDELRPLRKEAKASVKVTNA